MGGESRDPRLIIASYMNPNGGSWLHALITDAEYHKKEYKLLYEEFLNSVINNRLTPVAYLTRYLEVGSVLFIKKYSLLNHLKIPISIKIFVSGGLSLL